MYRCTDSECADLKIALSAIVAARNGAVPNGSDVEAAAFCLYASEWWRRHFQIGHWSWNDILESIGLPSHTGRNELYGPIRRGLRYWKRNLLTVGGRNAYFVTLACEGGLPLNLISGEEDCHLQKYLRALLREFRVYGGVNATPFELASRLGEHLPISLRQAPLFQTCGDLVERVWGFQSLIGESSKPVEELDQIQPNWRDSFPLVVSDDAAKALLNSLVKDAVKIARVQELRFSTLLERASSGFTLKRIIKQPSYFDAVSLAKFLAIPVQNLPYQIQIYLRQSEQPPHFLSLVTRRTAGDEGRFAIEIPDSSPAFISGEAAAKSIWIEARSSNLNIEVHTIRGGLGMSSLPWVFASKGDEVNEWELLGEGSIKTKYPEVLVAITPAMSITALDGQASPVGQLQEFGRVLHQISGSVRITWGDETSAISTKSQAEESHQYILSGDYLYAGVQGDCVYRGVPRILCCREGTPPTLVPVDQLQWKTQKGKDPWKAKLSGCSGPITIRHAPSGETRFLADIEVVPVEGKITFMPGARAKEGAIEVTGMGATDCGVSTTPSVQAAIMPLSTGHRINLSALAEPPAAIKLLLRWPLGQELALDVPYPARGVRFVGRDGNILKTDSKVHRSKMAGVIAQVMDPDPNKKYYLEAAVIGDNTGEIRLNNDSLMLRETAPGRHEIDLRQFQETCHLLLSAVDDLDTWIRIGVISSRGESFPQKIYVARYDMALEPDKETGEVHIPVDEGINYGEALDRIVLKTFPIADPGREPVLLSKVDHSRWMFMENNRDAGPWLITGWDGDWCRLRPLCWTVPGEANCAEEPLTLNAIVRNPKKTQRLIASDDLLQQLAEEPNHPDWKKIDYYFQHVRHLPPTTFDVIQRLARHPRAAAMALLRVGEEMFDTVWSGLERLPFSWFLVPASAWLYAARLRKQYLEEVLTPIAESLGGNVGALVEDSFKPFIQQAPVRFPGLETVVELLRNRLFNVPLEQLCYLKKRMAGSKSGRRTLKDFCTNVQEQDLLLRHTDDTWPVCHELIEEWWPQNRQYIPAELLSFWRVSEASVNFRSSVLNAPIAAAFAAGFSIKLAKNRVFEIRTLREFDPIWFDGAYSCALAVTIGYQLEHPTDGAL